MRQAIHAVGNTTIGPANTSRDSPVHQLMPPPAPRVTVRKLRDLFEIVLFSAVFLAS